MWGLIFGAFIVFVIILGIYLYKRLNRICDYFDFHIKKWSLIAITLLIGAMCIDLYSVVSLWMIHILVFTIFMDLIFILFKKKIKPKWWIEVSLPAIILSTIIVGYGYYNMTYLVKTNYEIQSSLLKNDYKILLIADSHYDTIQNKNVLLDQIEKWNQENYDFVLLDGDIVEEGTSKGSMLEVFHELGKINSLNGIYYVYGNHDLQRYKQNRAYSQEELKQTIFDSGIILLDNETKIIQDEIELIGRRDASLPGRKEITDYALLDDSLFQIVVDHQPLDYQQNAALGIELELSGHTHAGHVFPLGMIIEHLFGPCYGNYQIDDFHGIVTSGIAGWGFPIRTEKHCEYVEIDLKRE